MLEIEAPSDAQPADIAPPWTPVLDRTGQTIGSIADAPQQNGCLAIYKGLFFTRLVYIPRVYVAHTDSYGVHLSVRKTDLCQEQCADPLSAVALSA